MKKRLKEWTYQGLTFKERLDKYKRPKNTNGKVIIIILSFIFLLVVLINPFERKSPIGVPTDFYEKAEIINESDIEIYYFGDHNPFPEEVEYRRVLSLSSIPNKKNARYSFIVLDFAEDTKLTDSEVEIIEDLYKNEKYYIILLRNTTKGISHLIDINDYGGKLIMLNFIEEDNY